MSENKAPKGLSASRNSQRTTNGQKSYATPKPIPPRENPRTLREALDERKRGNK